MKNNPLYRPDTPLPNWQEFSNLFLPEAEKTITFDYLSERHEEILAKGGEILDQETYYYNFKAIFSFPIEGQVSLVGAFDEVFIPILGESNFVCDVNWDSLEEGDPFTITYLGETATCIEGFSDNDAYSEGIMQLTSILKKAGLVLKVPVEMGEGISSDCSLVLIDLDIWERGVRDFGNEALETLFINFDTFVNTPVPNWKEIMLNLIEHLEKGGNQKALDRIEKMLTEDNANNIPSQDKSLDHSELSHDIWVRPPLRQPLPITTASHEIPEKHNSNIKKTQQEDSPSFLEESADEQRSFFNNPILQVIGTIAFIIILLRNIIEYWR